MSAFTQVRRIRALLSATVLGTSALWAAVAAVVILAGFAAVDILVPLPLAVRRWAIPVTLTATLGAALLILWRGRHVLRLGRVALFIEEQRPDLNFALVTAVEPAGNPTPAELAALERTIARVPTKGILRRPVARALGYPAIFLALGVSSLAIVPSDVLERILSPREGDVLLRYTPPPKADAPVANRLEPIAVQVVPPRYARRESYALDNPTAVAALAGSRVVVQGRGAKHGMLDSIGAQIVGIENSKQAPRVVTPTSNKDTWSLAAAMLPDPAVMHLRDRDYTRLLVLQPIIDTPPSVILSAPASDTTLPLPKGTLRVDAQFSDDIGLARAELELMYTSGSGESFDTKQRIIGRSTLGGKREGRLRADILLDTMNLGPGDVLHIRAIAWDENDVTGPGKGESETRTIRIHDPRVKPNVNITAAKAAAIDTSIMSQRMLIMRAETLLARRPRIPQDDYTKQSLHLGVQQGALMGRVQSIIFELENVEGVGFVGQTPSSIILREAAEEMRSAEWELSIVQVPVALVHMRKALALLEKIRDANRYWFRGLLTTTPIEVDRVRMTGTDKANVAPRDGRERPHDARRVLLQRLDRAIHLLETDATAAGDSLQFIFATALVQAKDVSEDIGNAVETLRSGMDARDVLHAARRRLERPVKSESGLSAWGGVP